ncbi:MAG: LamG-like jellyroll fold domain-containing protein [Promethearchaeota archaeon]
MFYKPKLIPYALFMVLLVNYSILAININDFLDEEVKTTEFDQKIGNSSLLENKRVKNIKTVRPSTWQDRQTDLKIKEDKWKEWAPPWTPPAGYLEDPVDAVTDYHAPPDNGTIDDWSQMQVTDGIYSTLTESYISGNQATSWYSPSAYENNNGWSYPARMYVSDNSRASFNYDNENVVLYNFTLPDLSSYTIVGIEVRLEGYEYGSAYVDIALLWNARSNATSTKRIYLSASEYYHTVGGATDTWGQTWSSTDLSNANFGVKLTGQVGYQTTGYVDHVQVRIYYQTESGYEFDREFSFEDGAVYDEGLELAIKTGQISNESLNVDMWNASSSSWFNILNINDIDDYTWKNVSLSSYLPTSDSNLHFRFVDTTFVGDSYSNTWQIDSILIRYRLLSRYFLNRKNITIDHTQVAGPLTNFPVLIDLYDTDLHDDVQADGDDIIFTTPAGIKLAHQLEVFNQTYNNTYAHLLAWVKLPTLSSTIDTNISMYYTNTTIGTQEQPPSTWNEDFLAVWHLNETVTDEGTAVDVHLDSTWNTYHGDQDGNDNNVGLIGQGQAFDGIDDLVNVTAAKNLDPSADVTLSGWFKLDSTHSSASSTSLLIMGKYLDNYNTTHIVLVGTDYEGVDVPKGVLVFKVERNDEKYYKWTQQTTWAADTWYYFTCILDANNPENNKIYINGVDDTSSADLDFADNTLNLVYNADWGIGGGLIDDGNLPAGEAWFDGVLDEMRVAPTIRTTDWIATEYNNQNNPANFYSISLEEHMEDLDPPEIVACGVDDPGNGQPVFWAQVTDDFSGVANVNITLNGTEYEMTINGSGYWIYQPPVVNFNDSFNYFVNSSDFEGRLTGTTIKNVRFDKDTVTPIVDQWEYIPEIGTYGTFNANIIDTWGIIDTVIVNVTTMNGIPTALSALMRPTPSGYINDTMDTLERGIIEFVIIVNDTGGNSMTSTAHIGFVGGNTAPIAGNLTLSPDPVHSNESLLLSYDYSDEDGDGETGTEIRWYKNGVLQPEHNDTTTISASYLFKGDHWNVTVRPKDWKDFGLLETSTLVTILNSQPIVSTVRFTFEHVKITPVDDNRDFVLEDEALTLTYSFVDADPTDVDESTINWYLNDETQPQYTNWTTIPASITIPGEVWQAEILPHDGEEASAPILTKQMTIESRPDIHGHGFKPHSTAEGVYDIWVQADDELRAIDEVKYNITVNGLLVDGLPYIHRQSVYVANETDHWVVPRFSLLTILQDLDYSEAQFIDLLNTTLTVNVVVLTKVTYASTEYTIEQTLSFTVPITDEAPPRVSQAGVEWAGATPTSVTFWARVTEYGLGIDQILLSYEFRPVEAQTKFADLPHGPIGMAFNGTYYVATVNFSADQTYDILFQLSVSDLVGNLNADAYPEGWTTGRFRFELLPPGFTLFDFLPLLIIIVAVIGVGVVVAVRRFSGTELVGLDIDRVMQATAQVDKHAIDAVLDDHTLGIVISFFDQRHGPVPIMVEPPILKDNFARLIDLSDLAFSSGRFARNFEEELLSFFDFFVGTDAAMMSFTFSFSLERPEARAGSEDITLNIVVHKPYTDLISQFIKQVIDPIHEIHVLMDKSPSEMELITSKIVELRRLVSTIILAYENMYGAVLEEEE